VASPGVRPSAGHVEATYGVSWQLGFTDPQRALTKTPALPNGWEDQPVYLRIDRRAGYRGGAGFAVAIDGIDPGELDARRADRPVPTAARQRARSGSGSTPYRWWRGRAKSGTPGSSRELASTAVVVPQKRPSSAGGRAQGRRVRLPDNQPGGPLRGGARREGRMPVGTHVTDFTHRTIPRRNPAESLVLKAARKPLALPAGGCLEPPGWYQGKVGVRLPPPAEAGGLRQRRR
jgi:hypothetical protein